MSNRRASTDAPAPKVFEESVIASDYDPGSIIASSVRSKPEPGMSARKKKAPPPVAVAATTAPAAAFSSTKAAPIDTTTTMGGIPGAQRTSTNLAQENAAFAEQARKSSKTAPQPRETFDSTEATGGGTTLLFDSVDIDDYNVESMSSSNRDETRDVVGSLPSDRYIDNNNMAEDAYGNNMGANDIALYENNSNSNRNSVGSISTITAEPRRTVPPAMGMMANAGQDLEAPTTDNDDPWSRLNAPKRESAADAAAGNKNRKYYILMALIGVLILGAIGAVIGVVVVSKTSDDSPGATPVPTTPAPAIVDPVTQPPSPEPTEEAPTVTATPDPTTAAPTESPTAPPQVAPTTAAPTESPTAAPQVAPTTASPTESPTSAPTESPTAPPTVSPTAEPTVSPTVPATAPPTSGPTQMPVEVPATNAPGGTIGIGISFPPTPNTETTSTSTTTPGSTGIGIGIPTSTPNTETTSTSTTTPGSTGIGIGIPT